jgi:hypothetical protein
MHTRLTMEGRSLALFMGKLVAIGIAFLAGVTAMISCTSYIGSKISDLPRTIPTPPSVMVDAPTSYTQAAAENLPPAPNMFASRPDVAPQPVPIHRVYVYASPSPIVPVPVSVQSSGYRPSQPSQTRNFVYPTNFKYPTNFQSGYHPYSAPTARSK